jgi:superfamily II DNA or RNA helicase
MPFDNAFLEILVGNVDSRLRGPVPRQLLGDELNVALMGFTHGPSALNGISPLVFDSAKDSFLTGALPRVKQVLRRHGIRFRLRDHRALRRSERDWSIGSHQLRDYQQEVVDLAERRMAGIIDIGTGGGKTLLAAGLIARLGVPTLFLVTTRTLLAQAVDQLRSFLSVEPGVIGEGTFRPERLSVALVQSLRPGIDLRPWQNGALIFDEGHHATAPSFLDVIRRVRPAWLYCLSAVPFRRSKGDQAVLEALFGHRLTGGRYSARFLVDNGYACPAQIQIEPCRIAGDMTEMPFQQVYREGIVRNAERNLRASQLAMREMDRGRSVLILVEQVEHGRRLQALLQGRSAFVCSATPRARLEKATEDFRQRRLPALIATAGLFQEGVSIDCIEALIQAGGLKSRAKVLQSVGRGMRRAAGKRFFLYIDFFDDDSAGVLRAHSHDRFAALKEAGFYFADLWSRLPSEEPAEATPPSWAHVPGTNRFVEMDEAGAIHGRARCLRKAFVPLALCRSCEGPRICEQGGAIEWQEQQD